MPAVQNEVNKSRDMWVGGWLVPVRSREQNKDVSSSGMVRGGVVKKNEKAISIYLPSWIHLIWREGERRFASNNDRPFHRIMTADKTCLLY